MCGDAASDPSMHDLTPPVPVKPRTYVLSGAALEPEASIVSVDVPPSQPESRGSVALAVIGEMLNDAEKDHDGDERRHLNHTRDYVCDRASILREARDRVAAAGG